jgi:hypothetical protein
MPPAMRHASPVPACMAALLSRAMNSTLHRTLPGSHHLLHCHLCGPWLCLSVPLVNPHLLHAHQAGWLHHVCGDQGHHCAAPAHARPGERGCTVGACNHCMWQPENTSFIALMRCPHSMHRRAHISSMNPWFHPFVMHLPLRPSHAGVGQPGGVGVHERSLPGC